LTFVSIEHKNIILKQINTKT